MTASSFDVKQTDPSFSFIHLDSDRELGWMSEPSLYPNLLICKVGTIIWPTLSPPRKQRTIQNCLYRDLTVEQTGDGLWLKQYGTQGPREKK